jgi:hypothetical protein
VARGPCRSLDFNIWHKGTLRTNNAVKQFAKNVAKNPGIRILRINSIHGAGEMGRVSYLL